MIWGILTFIHNRSGSNVDVVAITAEGVDYRRNTRSYNAKSYIK